MNYGYREWTHPGETVGNLLLPCPSPRWTCNACNATFTKEAECVAHGEAIHVEITPTNEDC